MCNPKTGIPSHRIICVTSPLGLDDEKRRPGSKSGAARWVADRAIDKIRDRFGWGAVEYESALGLVPLGPDEFRELAEKDL
jgi:DNA polymerase IV